MKEISDELYAALEYRGVIDHTGVRDMNVGMSDYANKKHLFTPWAMWIDYPELTPWDHDIMKRVCRKKKEGGLSPLEQRKLDYQKIKHDCDERIRQIDIEIEQLKKQENEDNN